MMTLIILIIFHHDTCRSSDAAHLARASSGQPDGQPAVCLPLCVQPVGMNRRKVCHCSPVTCTEWLSLCVDCGPGGQTAVPDCITLRAAVYCLVPDFNQWNFSMHWQVWRWLFLAENKFDVNHNCWKCFLAPVISPCFVPAPLKHRKVQVWLTLKAQILHWYCLWKHSVKCAMFSQHCACTETCLNYLHLPRWVQLLS